MTATPVGELDDRAVLLSIQYLAEDLRSEFPEVVRTPTEARLVLSSLLAQTGIADVNPEQVLATEDDALSAARRALEGANADPDTHNRVEQLLADPPQYEQMGIESALGAAAVLAFLISWLQTKIEFRIHRKDGKTEVEFSISRKAADNRVLRDFADVFRRILGIPTSPTPIDAGQTDDEQDAIAGRVEE